MTERRVFKYPIGRLTVPDHFQPVLAGVQSGEFMLWAEVSGEPVREREFVVVGTGREIPQGGHHFASFQEGPYVWHVYEIDPPESRPRLS